MSDEFNLYFSDLLIKQFTCNNCFKSYTQKGNLMHHKKFGCVDKANRSICPICLKLFKYPYCLKRHMENVHVKTN